MTCEELRRDATGIAALGPEDHAARAAVLHARGCAGCKRALADGVALVALLRQVSLPAPDAVDIARARDALRAELRRERLLALLAGPWSLLAIAAASLVLVFVGAGDAHSRGELAARTGGHCLLIEGGAAALPVIALLVATRRGGWSPWSPWASAGLAAVGALAAQVILLAGCPVAGVVHAAVFHLGGVLLVALLGGAFARGRSSALA